MELPVIPQYIAVQLLAIFIAGGVEVDEEVDDGSEEVLGGVLEEGFASTFLITTTFVQRGKQCGPVSEAAAKSGMYFRWMGFTRLEYSTSVKLTMRKPQFLGSLPCLRFLQYW